MGLEAPLARIGKNNLTSLLVLIDCMERTPRLTDDEVKALYEPYSRRIFDEMLDTGESLGEVRGGTLRFLSRADDRSEIIARDQDFDWQLGVVSGCFSEFLQTGDIPPPHYAMRVAVLLRKSKLPDLERRFLEAWEKHFGGRGIGATYVALSKRLAKMIKKTGAASLALAFVLFGLAPTLAQPDIVIGRWCDRPIPNMRVADSVITIVVRGKAATIKREFSDRKSKPSTKRVAERGGEVYMTPSGDGYRIVSSSGDLQLFDGNGIIRTARRLENTPSPGDCLK